MRMSLLRGWVVAILLLPAMGGADEGKAEWGYEGDTGPAKWGELSPEFSMCGQGKNQSPINIDPKKNVIDAKQPPIHFDYTMLIPERIHHNGHTVQVDMRSGGEITVDGKVFKLKQFHFHAPGEHTIAGTPFPMEMHFVHQADDGQLAVVAVPMMPGWPHPTVATLWRTLPQKKGDSFELPNNVLRSLEIDKNVTNYYRYNGSLTTPPCSEGVIWIVKRDRVTVSKPQVAALVKVLGHPNNRPLQPSNARLVIE